MKPKYVVQGLVLLGLVFLAAPWGLNGLGNFLVVDDKPGEVDAVVAGGIFGKGLDCYRQGRCKKIIVVLQNEAPETWLALQRLQSPETLRDEARQAGVEDEDLYLLPMETDNDLQRAQLFGKFFAGKKIRSVLFLATHYQTRRYRFYFNRTLTGKDAVVYVQPSEDAPDFDGWWKKTTYANYFVSEYLRMAWYVFNKLLWTSAV